MGARGVYSWVKGSVKSPLVYCGCVIDGAIRILGMKLPVVLHKQIGHLSMIHVQSVFFSVCHYIPETPGGIEGTGPAGRG